MFKHAFIAAIVLCSSTQLASAENQFIYQDSFVLQTPVASHLWQRSPAKQGGTLPVSSVAPGEEWHMTTVRSGGTTVAASIVPGPAPVRVVSAKGGDLDCSDMSGSFRVEPGDPHRLDRDKDGWACE